MVQGYPVLVVPKIKNVSILDSLKNYQVRIELDKQINAFFIYEEFVKFGQIIGLYVIHQQSKYVLLYDKYQDIYKNIRPPQTREVLFSNAMKSIISIRFMENPINIHRPKLEETLTFQLQNMK